MPVVYCLAVLVSSALLFVVQPLCAKMVLPALGGTPAVWNTCMVFFQAGLLAGYAYAHYLPARAGVRAHAILHVVLLALLFATLPVVLVPETVDPGRPVLGLLALLTTTVALPFVLVASSGPLLQRWYAARYPGRDPYFLYAASNLGSFAGLLSYPLLLEPTLRLADQAELWRWAYLALVALTAACVPWRAAVKGDVLAAATSEEQRGPTWARRLRWVALALVPSSLLLSVTAYLTTDLAPIPLLWVVPLGLYLLTFTLVFARQRLVPQPILLRGLPLAVVVLLLLLLLEANSPLLVVLGLHLTGFTWLALSCHGALADDRPAPRRLTEFYLCLAVGGFLGGALNSLVAPLVFPGLFEYPLMLVLATPLCAGAGAKGFSRADALWPLGLGATAAAVVLAAQAVFTGPEAARLVVALAFAGPLVVTYLLHHRPWRFALALGALLLAGGLYHGVHGRTLYRERSYFGVHRVTELGGLRRLVHGTTIHGQQSTNPLRRGEPLTYYHRSSPIGLVFDALAGDGRVRDVGLVGLGAGSLAAYSAPDSRWTFYEIDPAVIRIANDPRSFTYLAEARGEVRVVEGDARLQLKRAGERYGLLVVDAFGSDSIPLHLLTREAMRVYLDRLGDDGLIAFHISNRYLDLEPVLANLAADADPPLTAYVLDLDVSPEQRARGCTRSVWLVMARDAARLPAGLSAPRWQVARGRAGVGVWTDDFSNVYGVMRWEFGGED